MNDKDRVAITNQRIEAQRWIILTLASALADAGALNIERFRSDLSGLATEMQKRENISMAGEVDAMSRLIQGLA